MRPLDEYLRRIRDALGSGARRSVLDEIEDHLREAAEDLEEHGATSVEAERRAITAFGSVDLIAAAFDEVLESPEGRVLEFSMREAVVSEAIEVEVSHVRFGPLTEDEIATWAGKDPDSVEQAKSDAALHGVVLKERSGDRELCIFMGQFEAAAIALGKEGKTFARPMTHDLMGDFMRSLDDFTVDRVTITRLEDKTFYAEISATHHGDAMLVDCRPSDGIAVALRLSAPIFVSRAVPPFSKAA